MDFEKNDRKSNFGRQRKQNSDLLDKPRRIKKPQKRKQKDYKNYSIPDYYSSDDEFDDEY